jgi:hypothetical protein
MVGTLGKHSWTIKQRTGNNRREKKIIIVRLLWNTKEKVVPLQRDCCNRLDWSLNQGGMGDRVVFSLA